MISVEDLRLALRLDPDDTDEDPFLEALEAAAVAYVERATGRYFGPPAPRTEYLAASGAQELYLADAPVAVSPSTDVVVVATLDGAEVDEADYTIRGRVLRHSSAWGWSGGPGDLVVTYSAGYVAGEEPADIREAVVQLVGHWYENRIPVALGTVAPEIAHTLRDMLAPWKRWTA